MRIIMLGTSAAMPNPDRHDSGILITVRDRHYLFDCGHGATNQIVAAGINPADVNHVFLSALRPYRGFRLLHDHYMDGEPANSTGGDRP
jgi:ribonuclease BN (tRNA processing enzyme)